MVEDVEQSQVVAFDLVVLAQASDALVRCNPVVCYVNTVEACSKTCKTPVL